MSVQIPRTTLNHLQPTPRSEPGEPLELDALIVGAGFSGIKLLHDLRKKGFRVKLAEAGSDLGGVWHWNRYPGARVDSPYPIYALNIPEVYNTWTWTQQYPGVDELQRYFAHIESVLHIKKDAFLSTRVRAATFNSETDKWLVECDSAEGKRLFSARFFLPCIGFAAKRHIPDWPGLDTFKGLICHSSFWPQHVDMKGKKVAVIGSGATGVQIVQECSKLVGPEGALTAFVRTPNIALPMNQGPVNKEQAEKDRSRLGEILNQRLKYGGGFLYDELPYTHKEHGEKEREELFEKLYKEGGFRLNQQNYNNLLTDPVLNRLVYDFWAQKTRARINDPRLRDILAPLEPPHPFAGKRPSLEQDYYEQFNRPNVTAVSLINNPITSITPSGLTTADGTHHAADLIILATGFDAVNGGMKDIAIRGLDGETLTSHWSEATYTYLGLSIAGFPNFFFTYGAQAPTAFSNGPSCLEPQCDFIERVIEEARREGWTRIVPRREMEEEWFRVVEAFSKATLRHDVKSWYMGANIPGKRKEALNYSGGLPLYIKTINEVADRGFEGFEISRLGK